MHFFDHHWYKERRLCFQHLTPPDALNDGAERWRESTDFTGRMMAWAKSLEGKRGVAVNLSDFEKDNYWRAAWSKDDTVTDPLYSPSAKVGDIKDPESFLRNLAPQERKDILLQYLAERFPAAIASKRSVYETIVRMDAHLLGSPAGTQAIETFLAIGDEMEGYDASVVANGVRSHFANPGELLTHVRAELTNRYRRGFGVTGRAFLDFAKATYRDPPLAETVTADPAALNSVLHGSNTVFARALKENIFTASDLSQMTNDLRQYRVDKENKMLQASKERRKMQNKIDVANSRNIVEKLVEGFENLDTWKRWTIAIVGSLAVYSIWAKKLPRVFAWPLRTATVVAGFYFLGGRQMIKGTVLEGALLPFEEGLSTLFDDARKRLGMTPDMTDDELRMYVSFIEDVATEQVNGQLEAMGYISKVPVDAIANSFTLLPKAKSGELNLKNDSLFSRDIEKRFGSTKQSRNILSKLSTNSADLGDAMAHAFFVLGAIEYPDDFHVVEQMRAGRRYDDIPDGIGRDTYVWLAQQGLKLAKTTYAGQSWETIIHTILAKIPPPASYPPGSPGTGHWHRSYPPPTPPGVRGTLSGGVPPTSRGTPPSGSPPSGSGSPPSGAPPPRTI